MPLWSQGFKVCIHPPLTDEPRIALDVGDLVNVTRWRKHWLFGEKIQDDTDNGFKNGKTKHGKDKEVTAKKRTRGWFPRQCAAAFFEDNDSGSDEEGGEGEQDKKKN